MNKRLAAAMTALCLVSMAATAKLPPPSEEAKLKAAEAKTKADETAAKETEQLTRAQDRVAERYIQTQKAKGVVVKPTPITAPMTKK